MNDFPAPFVAVIGGACAGSEAAYQLASRGIYVVVFEQQALPYGKIEDGLPKWHIKLRNKEEAKIDEKLSHPNVFFVPNTRLGNDLALDALIRDWGFSAVLLASGAWRDRPLPVEGIEEHLGEGFYYQNPFVDWFNHHHEPGYNRYNFAVSDEAIVIGGGLASIDVVKILMLETTVQALEARGIKTDVISLEHRGIPKKLEEFGLTFHQLGLKGCTLYYRRRNIDMPLGPVPDDPSPEKMAKMQAVRQKIVANAQRDYLFHFRECARPIRKITEEGRLAGLVFEETRVVEGRVQSLPGTEFEVRSPLIISSIGSIPEPIPGIPSAGELFQVEDEKTGKISGFDNVFALGNAVTGRGNIRESELHSRMVTQYVIDEFLRWDGKQTKPMRTIENRVLSAERMRELIARIEQMQKKVGYSGDYREWAEKCRPPRLEEIMEGVE